MLEYDRPCRPRRCECHRGTKFWHQTVEVMMKSMVVFLTSTYEMTVVYETNMGVSPATAFTLKESNSMTTAPCSPPQNIITQV